MPAYYAGTLRDFRAASPESLELQLTRAYEADRYKDLITAQITSWREQIRTLKSVFSSTELSIFDIDNWGIAIEFVVPRRMGRIDTVLLIGNALIVLEFKTRKVDSSAAEQIEDYCLDLLHFHAPSHNKLIYPVVVGVAGAKLPSKKRHRLSELQTVMFIDTEGLAQCVSSIAARHVSEPNSSIDVWNAGDYRPVPTIIEAAIAMFMEMEVRDIARSGCEPINLTATVDEIRRLAADSFLHKKKTICFITGVPGAGKTLAGLQVVHDAELRKITQTDSVFLTGNLPLVKVLRAALSEDTAKRKKLRRRISSRDPKTTIDTILGYKKTHTKNTNPPNENMIVFDEAQRAWNAEQTAKYLEDGTAWVGHSEPELILAILDRHPWALLIALVGGGQEINRGEAGLREWGLALENKFMHWNIALSPQALTGGYGAGAKLFEDSIPQHLKIRTLPALHLDNPTRQFRGKTIAKWAEALLQGDANECQRILAENPDYPIYLTRDLSVARDWLMEVSNGSERYGLIASSEARRLRAEGIEIPEARANGVEHWFLKPKGDVRASFQLEVAATEFQIQGLEIDWGCICWGGDFLRTEQQWNFKRLRGTKWQNVGQKDARRYILNCYRVLLTRARQGMVLFVPAGDLSDLTRPPGPFDSTAQFLLQCGVKLLGGAGDHFRYSQH